MGLVLSEGKTMAFDQQMLKNELMAMQDEKYRAFSSSLIPGITTMLGVRLPALRKIGKRIAKENWRAYLESARDDSFEEILLQGIVIGGAEMNLGERLLRITNFVPKIDNWSVCDSFCTGLKVARNNQKEVWFFLEPYLYSEKTYEIRFAVVMCIYYYIKADYLKLLFAHFDRIEHSDYYVKMAVAWAVATCFTVDPEVTTNYLGNNNLDDFTHNKSIQKITESKQVDRDVKNRIRKLKRKVEK